MSDNNKKILGLVASHRKNGNSDLLVRQALKGAKETGAKTSIINLTSLNIENCRGCLSCVFKGKCPIDDDMSYFIEQTLAADGLIVAAPTYLLSPAARLKQVMDRFLMYSPRLDEIDSKKRAAVTFSAAGNSLWNPLGVELINQFALASGFTVIDYREAYAPGPGEILLQEQLMEDAFNLGNKIVLYLDNKEEKREAESFQCPVCYGKAFSKLEEENDIQCPICLIKGKIIKGEGEKDEKLYFPEDEINNHFFTPNHRRHHLENWIKKTKEPYINKLEEIKEKFNYYFPQDS